MENKKLMFARSDARTAMMKTPMVTSNRNNKIVTWNDSSSDEDPDDGKPSLLDLLRSGVVRPKFVLRSAAATRNYERFCQKRREKLRRKNQKAKIQHRQEAKEAAKAEAGRIDEALKPKEPVEYYKPEYCTHEPLHTEESFWPLCMCPEPSEDMEMAAKNSNINLNPYDYIPPLNDNFNEPSVNTKSLFRDPGYIHRSVSSGPGLYKNQLDWDRTYKEATKFLRGAHPYGNTDAKGIPDPRDKQTLLSNLDFSYLSYLAAWSVRYAHPKLWSLKERISSVERHLAISIAFFLCETKLIPRHLEYYESLKAKQHYWAEMHHLFILMPGKDILYLRKVLAHERCKRLIRDLQRNTRLKKSLIHGKYEVEFKLVRPEKPNKSPKAQENVNLKDQEKRGISKFLKNIFKKSDKKEGSKLGERSVATNIQEEANETGPKMDSGGPSKPRDDKNTGKPRSVKFAGSDIT
ncbi:hypothetical protein ABW20_dc0110119 [Dactylellina cionopaga]|nr:hypothetical protein ABW20_dc0110119 [Dactylellina cionopaga]